MTIQFDDAYDAFNVSSEDKHVLYQSDSNSFKNQIYSNQNIQALSRELTKRLKDARFDNRPTIIPDQTIRSVLQSFLQSSRQGQVNEIYENVIDFIVDDVESEYAKENLARTYDINIQTYTSDYGLQQVPQIKLKVKKPLIEQSGYDPNDLRY